MEACGSANYWARVFQQLGHEVKLIAAQYVKPFVRGNKNDYRDAEAIVEAAHRPEMRFVAVKQVEQQDVQSLLRIREGYIETRTKVVNQMRGLLAEYGVVIPLGVAKLRKILPSLFERTTENGLTLLMKQMLETQYNFLLIVDEQIEMCDIQLLALSKKHETCQRLMGIEGIGIITALALYACVGNGEGFKNGRHFAAFLGLVPRQHSSGGKDRLLGISKRGDDFVRRMLIHGARSVVLWSSKKQDPRSRWINQLKERRGMNKTCVAVANKNARIVMAMLMKNEIYNPKEYRDERAH
jgi:transposase